MVVVIMFVHACHFAGCQRKVPDTHLFVLVNDGGAYMAVNTAGFSICLVGVTRTQRVSNKLINIRLNRARWINNNEESDKRQEDGCQQGCWSRHSRHGHRWMQKVSCAASLLFSKNYQRSV